MKRIFESVWFWTQLFLSLIIAVIAIVIFSSLSVFFFIKYAGFWGRGDNSPLTFAIASLSSILIFTFPILLWFVLNKFGPLKSASQKVKAFTFVAFATLPFWVRLGYLAFSIFWPSYQGYQSARDPCIIKNGTNNSTTVSGGYREEFGCKNGVLNGFYRKYNSRSIVYEERVYANGKLDGREKFFYDSGKIKHEINYKNNEKEGMEAIYNEDGSTESYMINEKGKIGKRKTISVYFRIPEDKNYIDRNVSLESQKFFCENREKYVTKNYSYSCSGNRVNGQFIRFDSEGKTQLKVELLHGIPNGIHEELKNGILYKHLEFKNGDLHGRVFAYSSEGDLLYEGQYVNRLQEGIFRRYYKGDLESEVVFENGKIIKIWYST